MSSVGRYGPDLQSIEAISSHIVNTTGISFDSTLLKRMDRMEKMIGNIAERLAILDDPSPKKLARHKMLKEAYTKYLFIEKLCAEENNES